MIRNICLAIGLSVMTVMIACTQPAANTEPVVKPEPLSAVVEPEFRDQAKALDSYCVTLPGEWEGRTRVLIADVEQKTEKKLAAKDLQDEAIRLAPEVANDPGTSKGPDGKFDCTTLLTRAVWKLVPELAPEIKSSDDDDGVAADPKKEKLDNTNKPDAGKPTNKKKQ